MSTEEYSPLDYFAFSTLPPQEIEFANLSDEEAAHLLGDINAVEVQFSIILNEFGIPKLQVSLPHGCNLYGLHGVEYIPREEEDTMIPNPATIWMEEMYVPSKFWGKGIAKRMIETFINQAKWHFQNVSDIRGKTPNIHALRSIYSASQNLDLLFEVIGNREDEIMRYPNGELRSEYIKGRPFGEIRFKVSLRD